MSFAISSDNVKALNNMCGNAASVKLGDVVDTLAKNYDGTASAPTITALTDTQISDLNNMCITTNSVGLGTVMGALTDEDISDVSFTTADAKKLNCACPAIKQADLGGWLAKALCIDATPTISATAAITASEITAEAPGSITVTWSDADYADKTYTASVSNTKLTLGTPTATSIPITAATAGECTVTITRGAYTDTCVVTVS